MIPVKAKEEEEKEELRADDEAVYAADPDSAEVAERVKEDEEIHQRNLEQELEKAPDYLDSYIKQKLVTEGEALDLRELYSVNEKLKKGEIDPEEAEGIRGQMDEAVRKNLDERMHKAVDYGVLYLNVFNALKRIPQDRDDILQFIIRNKQLIISGDPEIDFSAVVKPLEEDQDLLDSAIVLVERKDHEVRMICANMPPYRRISGENEMIGNITVEEAFIEELRTIADDELSERLTRPRAKSGAKLRPTYALWSACSARR